MASSLWNKPKGMDSAKAKIPDTNKALKTKKMDQGIFIKYHTGKFKISTKKNSYRITNLGIEFFEGGSKFSKSEAIAGIKIDNSGIVIMGNNNYARQEFVPVFKSLDDLDNRIGITDELDNETKINYQAELRTIQSQFMKQYPDKDIVLSSWERLKQVGSIASLVAPIAKIGLLISKVFGLTPVLPPN
jgi:hypothetical protein